MKQLNIPFDLGSHYEDWEFDLEIEQDRIQGCDSYIYIGKDFNKILNYSIDKTELIFSLDILQAVVITVINSNRVFEELFKMVTSELDCISEILEYDEFKICRFVTRIKEVWIIRRDSKLYFLITNSRYSIHIIKTLL